MAAPITNIKTVIPIVTNDSIVISDSITNDSILTIENIKKELEQWYGKQVHDWKMIKTYRIDYALPIQESVKNDIPISEIKISDTLFICGDHLLNGSINAAFKTGRLAAEAMKL